MADEGAGVSFEEIVRLVAIELGLKGVTVTGIPSDPSTVGVHVDRYPRVSSFLLTRADMRPMADFPGLIMGRYRRALDEIKGITNG
jgi:hypothetical protein